MDGLRRGVLLKRVIDEIDQEDERRVNSPRG